MLNYEMINYSGYVLCNHYIHLVLSTVLSAESDFDLHCSQKSIKSS